MKTCLSCLAVVLMLGLPARAQAPADPPASFDTASVKPSSSDAGSALGALPKVVPHGGGRFSASNMPLRLLIRMAYQLQDFQIVGGPAWQVSNRFDITAKAADSTASTPQDVLPLLKTLLADRFKLKVHTEKREMSVYALMVARDDRKLGPELKPSTADCSNAQADAQKRAEAIAKGGLAAVASLMPKPGETIPCSIMPAINPGTPGAGFGLRGHGQSMAKLTQLLTRFTGRLVQDKTDLDGLYDFELRFDPEILMRLATQAGLNVPTAAGQPGATSPGPVSPSLPTALQEQLGLKLDSQRAAVDVLVIDSAELPEPD
jgi:uncharacterized protein (TIGR03435 family)